MRRRRLVNARLPPRHVDLLPPRYGSVTVALLRTLPLPALRLAASSVPRGYRPPCAEPGARGRQGGSLRGSFEALLELGCQPLGALVERAIRVFATISFEAPSQIVSPYPVH